MSKETERNLPKEKILWSKKEPDGKLYKFTCYDNGYPFVFGLEENQKDNGHRERIVLFPTLSGRVVVDRFVAERSFVLDRVIQVVSVRATLLDVDKGPCEGGFWLDEGMSRQAVGRFEKTQYLRRTYRERLESIALGMPTSLDNAPWYSNFTFYLNLLSGESTCQYGGGIQTQTAVKILKSEDESQCRFSFPGFWTVISPYGDKKTFPVNLKPYKFSFPAGCRPWEPEPESADFTFSVAQKFPSEIFQLDRDFTLNELKNVQEERMLELAAKLKQIKETLCGPNLLSSIMQ